MGSVLITGGSEGIGFELARLFAKDGYRPVLCARSEEKLKRAQQIIENESGILCRTISADLSREDSAAELYAQLEGEDITHAVLCAGRGILSESWNVSAAEEKDTLILNVYSCVELAKHFMRRMKENGGGTIVFIASTGAFQSGPYVASYYASKAYIQSYAGAVQREAEPYGIHVSCVCPGPVRTGFYEKIRSSAPWYAMDAARCAAYIYAHLDRHMIVPGLMNRMLRAVPASLKADMLARMKGKSLKKKQDDLLGKQ